MFLLGNTLQRMILFDLVRVFLLALVALTGLFLMAGLVAEATQRGLAPSQILMIMPLLIPNTLPYTIPATTLFATCVIYGRLAHDNEVTAIKAAGVHLAMLLRPCLLLGVTTSAITMGLYYHLIPHTHQLMKSQFLSDGEEVLLTMLKRSHCIRHPSLPYVMYVRQVQGKRLADVIFKKRRKVNDLWIGFDLVARARDAQLTVELRPEPERSSIVVDMMNCSVWGDRTVSGYFKHRRFEMELPAEFNGGDKKMRPIDLTWVELQDRIKEVEGELEEYARTVPPARAESDRWLAKTLGVSVDEVKAITARGEVEQRLAAVSATVPGTEATEGKRLFIHAYNLEQKQRHTGRLLLSLKAEVQARPALAVGCLCFVLVGCPVGIWFSRADFLSAFVTCFLPTVLLYYPILLCFSNLARDGKFPIVPAIWLADAVFLSVSILLIWRLLRR